MAVTIIDPRQLPLVELVPIYRCEADGILDRVTIIGGDFITTFLAIMTAPDSNVLVSVPVLQVRRNLAAYTPNYLNVLLMEERKRLEHGEPRRRARAIPIH